MNWLMIVRRRAPRDKGGHAVELPGTIEGTIVEAPDRPTALVCARAFAAAEGIVGRVEVVAECSWRLMPNAERQRLLGDFTPPPVVA